MTPKLSPPRTRSELPTPNGAGTTQKTRLILEQTALGRKLLRRSVEDEDGCLLWTGATNYRYGKINVGGGKEKYTHRLAYELYHGAPPQHTIDHLCRKPLCIRYECLEDVTQTENNDRKPKVTHCPKGHEYTPDNTYIVSKTGWRVCRRCRLDAMKIQYQKKKTAS